MLQKYLEHHFSSRVRSRGETYFRYEAASLVTIKDNRARFMVHGSEAYQCDFIWIHRPKKSRPQTPSLEVKMFCTCPYFIDHGPCKHLWASLKEGDRRGLWNHLTQGLSSGPESGAKARNRPEKAWQRQLNRLSLGQTQMVKPASSSFTKIYYALQLSLEHKYIRFFTEKKGQLKPKQIGSHEIYQLSDPLDQELVSLITSQRRGDSETFYSNHDSTMIHPALEGQILKKICATNRGFLGENLSRYNLQEVDFLQFEEAMGELTVHLGLDKKYVKINTGLNFNEEKSLPLAHIDQMSSSGIYLSGSTLGYFNKNHYDWVEMLVGLVNENIPRSDKDLLVQGLFSQDSTPKINLEPNLGWKTLEKEVPKPKMIIQNEGDQDRPEFYGRVAFQYGNGEVLSNSEQNYVIDSDKKTLFARHKEVENQLLAVTDSLSLTPPVRNKSDYEYSINKKEFVEVIKALMAKDWDVEAEGSKVESAQNFDFSVTSGIDWFDLQGDITFSSGHLITLPELMNSLKLGNKLIPLGDGKVGMLPEDWLKKCTGLSDLGKVKKEDSLRFTKAQGLFLNSWFEGDKNFKMDKGFSTFQKALKKVTLKKKTKPLKAFTGELRDYQQEGLAWLTYLRDLSLGGILADDMGLGKTVQVIALLQKYKNVSDKKYPNLIVVPKSLVFNWKDEIEKFAPNLKALTYIGMNRFAEIRDSEIKEADIVITTYHTLRNDFDRLSSLMFNYIIVDEAQYIKNPEAQISQACKAMGAKYRLALTGTPIENSMTDLFSILDFVNPGLISKGIKDDFAHTTDGNDDGLKLLSKALAPMILRRTKKQVLTELPDKVESVIKCTLTKTEQKQYDDLKKYYQLKISQKIKEKGFSRSKIEVLEALLRLRQASCHPALIDNKKVNYKSAKLDVLFEQIHALASSGNKCLVFSQFTSFLQVIKPKLEKQKIPYLYLDGKTRNRKEMVETFENSQDLKVFLISLKAGGVGLNLTSANYVFILDPWWNPAVESQAIDRTYRIGQKNNVFAYKLIAKDTVEEKILQLQDRKKGLSDAVINSQTGLLKKMSVNDLNYLLS